MASLEVAEFNKAYAEEASNDSTLNPVAPEKQNDNPDLTISCPAILEPFEEDNPFFKKVKRPPKTYKPIMKTYNSTTILINYDGPSNDEECESRPPVWVHLFNRYKNFAAKFRNSNLIYIVQIWLTLLSFSAIIMGIAYGQSCPGSPNLIKLTVLTGIFGALLIGQWIAIGCCPLADRPCGGQQKSGILLFFILVSVLLEFEIYLFSKLSPSFKPSATNYCSKAFYDYTYYKFIAAFGSGLLIVLLYIPGYRSLASGVFLLGSSDRQLLQNSDGAR